MRHWKTLIEKDFVGSWDLTNPDGSFKEVTLKIADIQSQAIKSREAPKGKRKVVITFHNARKKMICNSTNCEAIEGMYGADVDKWIGQLITLYVADVRNPKGGGTIKGVKVRPQKPKGSAETLVEKDVDTEIRAEQDAAFDRGENPDAY